MLAIVDEFYEGQFVYVVLDTMKDFLYGEYVVSKKEYRGISNHRVVLSLRHAEKKQRYFKQLINLDGYNIVFKHPERKMKVYEDLNDAIKDFCKELKKNPEQNPKLENKFRLRYPNYF